MPSELLRIQKTRIGGVAVGSDAGSSGSELSDGGSSSSEPSASSPSSSSSPSPLSPLLYRLSLGSCWVITGFLLGYRWVSRGLSLGYFPGRPDSWDAPFLPFSQLRFKQEGTGGNRGKRCILPTPLPPFHSAVADMAESLGPAQDVISPHGVACGHETMECGDLSPLWFVAERRRDFPCECLALNQHRKEFGQRGSAAIHSPEGTCRHQHLHRRLGGDKSPHPTSRSSGRT